MPQASLILFESTKTDLLRGRLTLDSMSLSAMLVSPSYQPDLINHVVLTDIFPDLTNAPGHCVQVTGQKVENGSFSSDDIHFGDPITTGPVRYLGFIEGTPQSLTPDKRLIFLLDLTAGETVYEAQQGAFQIKAPSEGWFTLEAS